MIKKLILLILCFSAFSFAQQQPDDLQKLKDALVNQLLYSQALEKENTNLRGQINQVAADLKKVKTMVQLDSLKVVYGIDESKKDSKKGK
jgi:hypothetical protein